MKRAQINNIFTILITLLVVTTIAVLSVRFINGLLDDRCTSDLLIFENTIQNAIQKGNNYGTVEEKRIPAGCGVQTLCLVDAGKIGDTAGNAFTPQANQENPLIVASAQEGVEANIFSYDEDGFLQEHGYVSQLALEQPEEILCLQARAGVFTLKLQGQAVSTLVSLP
jgi:hypothetical protein